MNDTTYKLENNVCAFAIPVLITWLVPFVFYRESSTHVVL